MSYKLNRRDFLKLATTTVSLAAIEGPLAAFWPDQQDHIPTLEDPQIILVESDGYLKDPNYDYDDWPTNREHYGEIDDDEKVELIRSYIGDDEIEELFEIPGDRVVDSELISTYQYVVDNWYEESLDPDQLSFYDLGFKSEYWPGYDLFYHRDGALVDDLDLVLIEGEYPGSSFTAVKMRKSVKEANQILAKHGLNIQMIPEPV